MLCIFDFDGTLADSKAAYYKTVQKYADRNGFPAPSRFHMDMAFGNPNPPLLEGWGDMEECKQHLNKVFSLVDDVLCEDPHCMPLYPGVYKLLESLFNEGLTLSIVTSRNLKPLLTVMDAHDLMSMFTTIRSAQDMIDKGYRGKPYPDKLNCVLREFHCPAEKAIMVGDTHMDMTMAKNAGVFALGVAWGYHDRETLLKHGADAVASDADGVLKVVRERLQGL